MADGRNIFSGEVTAGAGIDVHPFYDFCDMDLLNARSCVPHVIHLLSLLTPLFPRHPDVPASHTHKFPLTRVCVCVCVTVPAVACA